jgi:hypothetical protein
VVPRLMRRKPLPAAAESLSMASAA